VPIFEKMKINCIRKNCKEEARFRIGTLKNPKLLCPKHYGSYLRLKNKRRPQSNSKS